MIGRFAVLPEKYRHRGNDNSCQQKDSDVFHFGHAINV
jgi:hypothetical protein